jgi:8-oxo-dGTP diphosphatase
VDKIEKIRVVAAVIERDVKFLICRRPADKRHGGLWEFPGGKLEPGETAQAAAHRELAEELGVRVRSCGEQRFAVNDPDSNFVIEFHPVEIDGNPACLEHSALAWVSVPDMLLMDLAPSDRRFALFLQESDPTGG